MAAQFDLYQVPDGPLVVILQADLLDGLRTRVVAPLLPLGPEVTPMRHLNPVVEVGQGAYVLMPQLMATLTVTELGQRRGSLAAHRDAITRALDMVWSGV